MVIRVFAWNPYRFHCYGVPASGTPGVVAEEADEIWIADIFPSWMVPGLALHEWVELRTGSHRLGLLAEVLAYNLVWPIYHLAYLWIIKRYPLSSKLFA